MKIQAGSPVYVTQDSVRTKRDGQGGAGQQHYEQQSKRDQRGEEDPEEAKKKVAAAVESFSSDQQAQASGIQAFVENSQGPGLRVVLKDCNGTVVRQLSGEEFLRLREATANGSPRRGKILDQKL